VSLGAEIWFKLLQHGFFFKRKPERNLVCTDASGATAWGTNTYGVPEERSMVLGSQMAERFYCCSTREASVFGAWSSPKSAVMGCFPCVNTAQSRPLFRSIIAHCGILYRSLYCTCRTTDCCRLFRGSIMSLDGKYISVAGTRGLAH
jgi:hypothetical protein